MRIVSNSNRTTRTVYAWQEGDEFLLSPFAKAVDGYRPIDRFDSKEQLEAHVAPRRCNIEWQAD